MNKMIIKELILYKFKRLKLNNINKLVYRPKEMINVILGRNGSGKSSIFLELSPLPADPSDYYKDGYKKITIEFNKKTFVLTSYANKRHSFIINGKELNNGGTKTVQLELVKEYFNYDKNIHEYLTGIKQFTETTVSERKNLLTTISNTSFDYPLALLNFLKDKEKEIKTLIKYNTDRLSGFKTDGRKLEDIENDIERLKELKIKLLSEVSDVKKINKDKIMKNLNLIAEYNKIESEEEIKDRIKKIEDRLIEIKSRVKYLKDEINNLNKNNLDNYKDKIDLVNRLENEFKDKEYKDVTEKLITLQNLIKDIIPKVEFLLNSDSSILDLDIKPLQEKIKSNELEIRDLLGRKEMLKDKLEHIEKHKEIGNVKCPKCNNIFNPIDKDSEDRLTKLLNRVEEQIDKLIKESDTYKKTIDESIEKTRLLYEIKDKLYTLKFNVDKGNLSTIENKLINMYQEYEKLQELYKRYEKYIRLKKEVDYIKDLNLKHNREKIELLDKEYKLLMKESEDLVKKYEDLNKRLKKINEVKDLYFNIHKDIVSYRKELFKDIYNKHINIYLNKIEEMISELITEKSKIIELNKNIKIIENEIKQLNNELTTIKHSIIALSPNKGIIGDSVMAILNNLMFDINDKIKEMWSYPLELLPCKLDGETLDYKFPVIIDNKIDDVVKDIKLLSSGTKEVVNHAFKLVLSEWLGLEGYPIFLDEFGRAMDVIHRNKAYEIVDKLFTQGNRQVFMVSHFEEQYGRLSSKNGTFIKIDDINNEYNNPEIIEIS